MNVRSWITCVVITVAGGLTGCGSRVGPSCGSDLACDDGATCTADACIDGHCVHIMIDGCEGADSDPTEPAGDAQATPDETPAVVDQEAADDAIDSSSAQACAGDTDCDDHDACTADACIASECIHLAIEDCDGGPCTLDQDCDDDNVCTADGCIDTGCVNITIAGV